MRGFIATLAAATTLYCVALTPTHAEEAGPVQVTSGIKYELIARWDVDRLNKILQVDIQKFAGVTVTDVTP